MSDIIYNQLRGVKRYFFIILLCIIFFPSGDLFSKDIVELHGDKIEYSMEGNKVLAEGRVEAVYKGAVLRCDRIEFFRDRMLATAYGDVHLIVKDGQISADKITYNFETGEGDFLNSRIVFPPFYGAADKVYKFSDGRVVLYDGYITTSDFDDPEYRLTSSRIDLFPGEKVVSKDVRMLLGKVPIMFLPRYTQSLKDRKAKILVTPGYDKDWGLFLLSQWRYYLNDDFKGTMHLDAREKKDIAWGIDLDYTTKNMGSGIIRTYYMNERSITAKRFYRKRPSPTIERERFRAEWRHKWEIDDKTDAILQYYKLSDDTFLKDYFESEYDKDNSPDTYFFITRNLSAGTLSFRTEARVNRFEAKVERLPEIQYNIINHEIANTGVYVTNTTTYSNLVKKEASPSEVRQKTMRLDVNTEISYPMKVSFIEVKPYVGGRHTYYSRAKNTKADNSIRGMFSTGVSMSTKFYRIFDVDVDTFGVNIHRLRHIVTPTISYSYKSNPTIPSSYLDSYDSIDSQEREHKIVFGLENKFQTKRNDKTVDFARVNLSTDFYLKEHPGKGGFNQITADIDILPSDWLKFYFDAKYDTHQDALSEANFDIYINGGGNWSFNMSKRWKKEVDDQITTQLNYTINPKWKISLYERIDVESGSQKEFDVTVTRDLHAWQMEINFNETRNSGDEILLIFRLKAFPDVGIEAGTSFNKRKAGSQSYEEE